MFSTTIKTIWTSWSALTLFCAVSIMLDWNGLIDPQRMGAEQWLALAIGHAVCGAVRALAAPSSDGEVVPDTPAF